MDRNHGLPFHSFLGCNYYDNVKALFLPDLPFTFVVIMGLSQGSYISGKIVSRSDIGITQIVPQEQERRKTISIYGSNFGNVKETIWIDNIQIQGEDKEAKKDIIDNWVDERIDIFISKSVTYGEHEIKVGRGGSLTSPKKLKIIKSYGKIK